MYKLLVVICLSALCQFNVHANQKQVLNEYMSNERYAILFDEEHFDHDLDVFKPTVYSDSRLFFDIQGEQYSLIKDLYFSMKDDTRIHLSGSLADSKILDKALANIDRQYPKSKERELLAAMNCAAASVLDDFSCGAKFWNKVSASTTFSLAFNTLTMAPLVAADLITTGAASTARNSAKAAAKTARPILIAKPSGIAQKITINGTLLFPKAMPKVIKVLEKVPLTIDPVKFQKMVKLLNSDAFKMTKSIVEIALKAGGDLTELSDQDAIKLRAQLLELSREIPNFKANCSNNYSDETCAFFDSLDEDEISDAGKTALNAGLGQISLVIGALESKLAAVVFEFINAGIIDPLTDNEDSDVAESLITGLTEAGFVAAEFIPAIGPVVSWINSIRKVKNEIAANYNDAESKYILFVAARLSKIDSALIRFQVAVIEDTIWRIKGAVNDIAYQIINPNKLWPRNIDYATVTAAFEYNFSGPENYFELVSYIDSLRESCAPMQTSLHEFTLNETTYQVTSNQCKTIEFTPRSASYYKVVFDINVTFVEPTIRVQHVPLGSFSDVAPQSAYAGSVNYLLSKGILDASNTHFSPTRAITRGEFYALMERSFFPEHPVDETLDWSLKSLEVLKEKLTAITLSEQLNAPITAMEVAEIISFEREVKSQFGFLQEARNKSPCAHLSVDLLKLLAHSYLVVPQNRNEFSCQYNITNESSVTRAQAARLIVNALEGGSL